MPEHDDANTEWELAEFVDAVAASVDQAADTLALKSNARDVSYAIKALKLDIGVGVRRPADGRVLFRTVEPEQEGATILRLDFAQVLEGQLSGLGRRLGDERPVRPLETLDGISEADVRALAAVAVFSVDDLERYTQTAAMASELSRKTGIEEHRVRRWRDLPYLRAVDPVGGQPSSRVVIAGGNLGSAADDGLLLFRGQAATVEEWTPSRITARMPADPGEGLLFAVVGGQVTNALPWRCGVPELKVASIVVRSTAPRAGDDVVLDAELVNAGGATVAPFDVRWSVDGAAEPAQPHGALGAGQRSTESSSTFSRKLSAGRHAIRFEADVQGRLPPDRRRDASYEIEVAVAERARLSWGLGFDLSSLDPFHPSLHVRRLLFGGLARRGPGRRLVPDLAEPLDGDADMATRWQLREGARFHDGEPVQADDVLFSYERAAEDSPWAERLEQAKLRLEVVDERTVRLIGRPGDAAADLLARVPVVPRAAYVADPAGFSTRPIGSGPFALGRHEPGVVLELRAHHGHVEGPPRLDEVRLALDGETEALLAALRAGTHQGLTLPFDKALAARLANEGRWVVRTVSWAGPTLLDVQSREVRERDPGADDLSGAHLWYVTPAAGG